MLENLKIALRKQKKLLLLFFLTIFIPSVTLSIFGLQAIRNERFRLAEQIENEHRRMAELLKSQIASVIEKIDSSLRSLSSHAAFLNRDYAEIDEIVSSRLAGESFLSEVVIVYRAGETLFPFFQSLESSRDRPPYVFTASQRSVLKEAEEYEHKQKNFGRAMDLYEGLASSSDNASFKAEMLANAARCAMRNGFYTRAIQSYSSIAKGFPGAISSSGLPLGLTAELQIMECYKKANESQKYLESAVQLYKDLLAMPWNLTRAQYNIYRSMVENDFQIALEQSQNGFETGSFEDQYRELKNRHEEYVKKWQKVEDIRQGVVPELRRILNSEKERSDLTGFSSLKMKREEFLLLGAWIPGDEGSGPEGILAAEIDERNLREEILNPVVFEFIQSQEMNIVISSLQGEELIGSADPGYSVSTVTTFFEDNFPPWKIEFFRSRTESSGLRSLSRSFYFWTILTLLLILTFGAVLISRTLSQEMAILKIKSDFVSSVSHELKTPLTSIKALIERLKEGKVKDSDKMNEYYSLISHDTEKLSRLVKNILDFSKIEEGKLKYELAEMDIGPLVKHHIEAFKQDDVHRDVQIHIQIAENIPFVLVDRDALGRAIDNLLNNAIKFSPENPEVSVNVRCEKNKLIISVQDRGIGIPEDEIDKIFDKFYQGKNAIDLTVKGTGLGLTLVKHIAEAHGGKVAVESEPGQGSTFLIVLPVNSKKI
jgi:signal transduction histidine kinase